MKWTNVLLIMQRELRDQLRDRRTLFTVAVLPLLLYPLLGMCFLQMSQFMRDHQSKIWIFGASHLPAEPALLQDGGFDRNFCPSNEAELLSLEIYEGAPSQDEERIRELVQTEIRAREVEAVIYFPPDFKEKLNAFRESLKQGAYSNGDKTGDSTSDSAGDSVSKSKEEQTGTPNEQPSLKTNIPQPIIFANTAEDKSRIASDRVERVLRRWKDAIVRENLVQNNIPLAATEPFELANTDVAEDVNRRAAVWSKLLPFVALIWALTGAFYPAIDLCAGEKERGTLETLLCSPAERVEIVIGKLLTIMSFSLATAFLNLVGMMATGAFVIAQFQQMQQATGAPSMLHIGAPPIGAVFWLAIVLPPVSALFSALSLAIAAFARSSKEGQYYLMPLLLVTLPLMILPLLPAAELNLGSSIIPVTGLVLLLRSLIESQYMEALRYALPVTGVTAGCCLLAVRWAVDQFQNESVLFRESERWRLGLWLRHLVRDRDDTPGVGEAIFCGVLLLLIRFFAGTVMSPPESWGEFAASTAVTLIALIATPALLMAIMLTNSPRKTLLLQRPPRWSLAAAFALALLLHPAGMCLAQSIKTIYPISNDVAEQLAKLNALLAGAPSFWMIVFVLALIPAICEELAFRGFILSGLRHSGHKWAAIVITSIFFGITHGILQQSLTACAIGLVIGFLAVQTGSLGPCIVFHFTFNTASLWISLRLPELIQKQPFLKWLFFEIDTGVYAYRWPLVILGALAGVAILYWFRRLPQKEYKEEVLQKALDRQSRTASLQAAHLDELR